MDILKIAIENGKIPSEKLGLDNTLHRTPPKKTEVQILEYLKKSEFHLLNTESFINEVVSFIKENHQGEIIFNYEINGSSCDVFVKEKNIAFKFITLFKYSEIFVNKNEQLNTYNNFSKENIKIIQIFEDSWNKSSEIIKSRILNLLGASRKLYARSCKVKQITDTTVVSSFLRKNHLQGTIGSSIKLGLYHNDELVSIMTFGNLRKNLGQISQDGYFELLRFCNILNTNVVGSASKLFKHFLKQYDPKSIISYADKCWSDSQNNIYTSLGLEYRHESDPSYFYIIGTERKGRFGYRKDTLLDCGYDGTKWTEHTMCLTNGLYRIFDTGTCKYEYLKNNI